MERLTHEADFGLEDWEETLFFVKSDPNGAYNIIDIAKYQGEPEFDEILKNVALRLAAYEDTGLEPEEIEKAMDIVKSAVSAFEDFGVDRLAELAKADREGRCVVLPCKVEDDVYINILGRTLPFTVISISQMSSTPTFKAQHGIRLVYIFKADDVGETVFMTRAEAESALQGEREEKQ